MATTESELESNGGSNIRRYVRSPSKRPTLIIYWADTRRPLTHREMNKIIGSTYIIDITPEEVLLLETETGRKVVIRGSHDPYAPPVPPPK